ncbi:MAG: hypothetical protein RJA05_730 [Planctomycetota bacterium]|jgi:formylglycine-generating enzyme required for sulfatase activity
MSIASRAITRSSLLALPLAMVAMMTRPATAQCVGDLTGNGTVDSGDLGILLAGWGSDGSGAPGSDISGDGIVDGADLGLLMTTWGPCIVVPAWATLIEAQPGPADVWDADLRAAIAATGLAWRVKDTLTQIEMVLIPPGSFLMGCSKSDQWGCDVDGNETPTHKVTLTNAFYLGRYEVTQGQWQTVMGSNPSYWQNASSDVPAAQVPHRPVERVSWNNINNFGAFLWSTDMRLPTEAEWEYAYRAGTTTAFHGFAGYPSGATDDALASNIAWHVGNACAPVGGCMTHPVGQKLANGFGVHDMGGNVWEWVADRFGAYPSEAQTNPTGPATGSYRVLRGGSAGHLTGNLRASFRTYDSASNRTIYSGFRVARSP